MKEAKVYTCLIISLLVLACSHTYDPDTLDLDFYQWNLWYDTSYQADLPGPSCGWEDLHRGMGKLVRIPAMAKDHFQEQDGGVLWFHCRFTLPENWEERKISLEIRGAAPALELFLNEEQIAAYKAMEPVFAIDVSDRIFYTRDNHLALKIHVPNGPDWSSAGISEGVVVKSFPEEPGSGDIQE